MGEKTVPVSVFLDLLRTQVGRGIYVWGGDGQNVSAMSDPVGWIERHETSAANAARSVALYEKRLKTGVTEIRAFDCSGLVYWALHKLGLQKSDISSRGLYAACDKITEAELRPGDLVFHHDGTRIVHVGVCTGEKQIECRGRDFGVVENKRKAGYWNRFGRWKTLKYDEDPQPEPEPGAYVFTRLLKLGCKGEDVIELKKLLIAHGYNKGITTGTAASKNFGRLTCDNVKEYQRAKGLEVDGIAGHDTIMALGGVWRG